MSYITRSGRLAKSGIKHVIHTVGPRKTTADVDRLLKLAYLNNCLVRANEKGVKSISFPAISIEIFGINPEKAAELFYEAIQEFSVQHPGSSVESIRLIYWTGGNDQVSLLRMLSLIN